MSLSDLAVPKLCECCGEADATKVVSLGFFTGFYCAPCAEIVRADRTATRRRQRGSAAGGE